MTTITKKQAQEIIDAADAVITALAGTNDDVHPDNHPKMCQLYDELNDRYATPEIVRELARIASLSLDAKPVAWRYDDGIAKGMAVTVYKCVADSWIARGYKATPLFESVPAQPALVENLKKVMNSWLAMEPKLASQPEFTDVMMLLDAEPADAQITELKDENEYIRKRFKELDRMFGKNLLVMQAAIIEWRTTGDAKNGMAWIFNTLFGPGELPSEDEKDAQAYFDREYAPIDKELMELSNWFHEYHKCLKEKQVKNNG